MTNYYIKENGNIIQSADHKFDDNCLATEENIVRNDDGILMLESDYNNYIQTDEYKAKVAEIENENRKTDLQTQIEALDIKRIRAIAEPSLKDDTTTWLEYYTQQITQLRAQL